MDKIFKLIDFGIKGDERGSLIALESHKDIPFEIKRVYYIYDTKKGVSRGLHAHKNLQQVLICLSGSFKIRLDDGHSVKTLFLNNPSEGLFIDSLIWREMFDFSRNCVLLVLANKYYDEDDYIRSYEYFKNLISSNHEK